VASTNLIGNRTFSDPQSGVNTAPAAVARIPTALGADDLPNTTGGIAYAVQGAIGGGATLTYSSTSTFMSAREIQI
jgi:hypothetical protein